MPVVLVVRAKGVGMCQMREGGNVPFWEGAQNGISAVLKAEALIVPRASRVAEVRVVCISDVVYQNVI